ncbi:MAG: hypothetical protein WD533_04345 [Dehalococcoidia bacterium]
MLRVSIPRMHLPELEDEGWLPSSLRNALRDLLRTATEVISPYDRMAGRLAHAVRASGATNIIDLCSGSGGPAVRLRRQLDQAGCHVPITLTDLYPDPETWGDIRQRAGEGVRYVETPTDATAVPEHLTGFRTLFTAFHHFRPEQARQILVDAVTRRQGIAVFEQTERRLAPMLGTLTYIPLTLLAMPFVRPFRLSRLVWTYFPPVTPIYAWWEGFASCWRSYTLAEMEAMLGSLPPNDYVWEMARQPSIPAGVTYLIGYPPAR